jgi:site-specific recombinase XerC
VNATLSKLQSVVDMAQAEGLITRNPVRLVTWLKKTRAVHKLWTGEEESACFDLTGQDRSTAVIELFSRALRPDELCGIRWEDIAFATRAAEVGKHVRTMVDVKPVEKEAKTEAGLRTLPLDKAT